MSLAMAAIVATIAAETAAAVTKEHLDLSPGGCSKNYILKVIF
jgi:hypothetical protein